MGWKGNGPLLGETICAQTTAKIALDSKNIVNLKLQATNCKESPFKTFSQPMANICKSLPNGQGSQNCQQATAKSYQVSFIGKENLTDAPPKRAYGITSGCQPLLNSSFDLMRLPFGEGETAGLFGMEITFFRSSDDCNTQNDSTETFYFHGGISQNVSPNSRKIINVNDGNTSYQVLFEIKDDPCLGNELNTFAGGIGTNRDPYLICNANHLLNVIDKVRSDRSASFKLLKDIELENVVISNQKKWKKCVTGGDNYLPIGHFFNETSQSCSLGQSFKGIFDGNYKIISGLKITQRNLNPTGFFSSTEGATIKNLRLKNPRIISTVINQSNSSLSLGALVGAAAKESRFENIVVEKLNLIRKSSVVGDVGGLIGTCARANITKVLIDGIIDSPLSDSVGGVAGVSLGCGVNFSRFEGMVQGRSGVGGIVGSATSDGSEKTQITNNYVHGIIKSTLTSSPVNQGGIVGVSFPGTSVTKNYFFGKHVHGCTGNTNCKIYPIGETADKTNFYPTPTDSTDIPMFATNSDKSIGISKVDFLSKLVNSNRDVVLTPTIAGLNQLILKDYALDNVEGDIPRFKFESEKDQTAGDFLLHPCRKNMAYLSLGRQNPQGNEKYLLCNRSQIEEISLNAFQPDHDYGTKNFELTNFIFIDRPISNVDHSESFTGTIDGAGRDLLGFTTSTIGAWLPGGVASGGKILLNFPEALINGQPSTNLVDLVGHIETGGAVGTSSSN